MREIRIPGPGAVVVVAAIGLAAVLGAWSGPPMMEREAGQYMPRKVYRVPQFPTDPSPYIERLVFSCHSTLPQPGAALQSARCIVRIGSAEFPVTVRPGETFSLELGSGLNDLGNWLQGTTGVIECPEGPWMIDVYAVSTYVNSDGMGGWRGTLVQLEQIK